MGLASCLSYLRTHAGRWVCPGRPGPARCPWFRCRKVGFPGISYKPSELKSFWACLSPRSLCCQWRAWHTQFQAGDLYLCLSQGWHATFCSELVCQQGLTCCLLSVTSLMVSFLTMELLLPTPSPCQTSCGGTMQLSVLEGLSHSSLLSTGEAHGQHYTVSCALRFRSLSYGSGPSMLLLLYKFLLVSRNPIFSLWDPCKSRWNCCWFRWHLPISGLNLSGICETVFFSV